MNRAERRKLEKQFGLAKAYQKGSKKERAEIKARRREMGIKLHQQNLENNENAQRKADEDLQVKQLQSLVESGKSDKEAKEILSNRIQGDLARKEKLLIRRERQANTLANKKK
jgi:hypothetical protein